MYVESRRIGLASTLAQDDDESSTERNENDLCCDGGDQSHQFIRKTTKLSKMRHCSGTRWASVYSWCVTCVKSHHSLGDAPAYLSKQRQRFGPALQKLKGNFEHRVRCFWINQPPSQHVDSKTHPRAGPGSSMSVDLLALSGLWADEVSQRPWGYAREHGKRSQFGSYEPIGLLSRSK